MMAEEMDDQQLVEIRQLLHYTYGVTKEGQEALAIAKKLMREVDVLRGNMERLRAREAEWDSKEQALQKSIAEHERVIAKIEARYEEQGQYNHELVRRLADAMGIVRAVVEAGVGDEYGGGTWLMFAGYDAETVRAKARALLADGEGQ